ncbi:hypothetical protein HZS_3900 [Henneguya salminicola]|uniref:Eukaryotic translation initiation factor 2 subunit 1 (Trinotate prediction) n=1 Tax=Henneguya salminicola TaxID=69463 RepID=A0A6G3MJ96_HENSL|nr:hypothetical protein HZS_3900 [Henneguya salminicola]
MGIKTKPDLEHLMSETAWKFHEKFKNNGGAYEAFRLLLTQTSLLDDSNITPTQKEILISSIRHRFEPKKAKIRSDIEVTCYTHEGIESVRSALLEGIKLSIGAEAPVKINLISPPIYMVSTIVFDRDEGLRLMNNVVETIRTEIMLREGHFNLKLAPKIVTDIDEAELARQMENLERAKDPIDGDDLSSESESEEQVSQLMENRIES